MPDSMKDKCKILKSEGLDEKIIARSLSISPAEVARHLAPSRRKSKRFTLGLPTADSPFVLRNNLHRGKVYMEERGTYIDTEEGKAAIKKYEEEKRKPHEPYDVKNMPSWNYQKHIKSENKIASLEKLGETK